MSDQRGLMRGTTPMLVLSVLNEEPLHGYEMIRRLSKLSQGVFDMKEGTLYPVLHELEKSGYATASWKETGGRRRRVYEITPKGQKHLMAAQKDWGRMVRAVDAVLKGDGYAFGF